MTTTAANPNTCEATCCSPYYEVLGWAWAEACLRLDNGEDPRKIEIPLVMLRFNEAFKANNKVSGPEPAAKGTP